jgi:hypothetical protein
VLIYRHSTNYLGKVFCERGGGTVKVDTSAGLAHACVCVRQEDCNAHESRHIRLLELEQRGALEKGAPCVDLPKPPLYGDAGARHL